MAMNDDAKTVVSDYLAAYALANPGVKAPEVRRANLLHTGWFIFGGRRIGRKTLIAMTERLRNRAAGVAQMTNAELVAAGREDELDEAATRKADRQREDAISAAHMTGGDSIDRRA